MMDLTPATCAQSNLDELSQVVNTLDGEALETIVTLITQSSRVFFTGSGRSGLAAKAVGMRLMHIGVPTFAVGEISTPAIGEGDLLVVFTSSGRGSMLEQARTAIKHEARVAVVTTQAEGDLIVLASAALVLPIHSTIHTDQHAGSLFEQSALIVGDALMRVVQHRLDVDSQYLDQRHANLS